MKLIELFPTVTYRSNTSGSLQAAYIGGVRVGYVERRTSDWIWQLNLIRPEGGAYFGRAADEQEAKGFVLVSLTAWLDAANLQPKEITNATLADIPAPARTTGPGPSADDVRGSGVPKPQARKRVAQRKAKTDRAT